jgi:pseudaminic acid cytidylyltransferase
MGYRCYMSKENQRIAVIPARGGSKRIPRKNIKPFLGKPALGSTIEIVLRSRLFSAVIVTTDDTQIAQIAIEHGATYVIPRPDHLASDQAITVPTVAHALEVWANETGQNISQEDLACCIYPVNPFLSIEDLREGFKILQENEEISYVNPVCTYAYPIERALTLDDNFKIKMLNPDKLEVRSQDTTEAFHDAGQWYLSKAHTWMEGKALLHNSIGIVIPRWRVQDIDTEEDWVRAELLKLVIIRQGEIHQ